MPKLSPELEKALRKQRKKFIRKFGREPGEGDPVFFDEEADTPQPLDEAKVRKDMLEAMAEAEVPPQLIYAFCKTGMMVGPDGYRNMAPEDRSEWDAAIDEFYELEEAQEGRLQ